MGNFNDRRKKNHKNLPIHRLREYEKLMKFLRNRYGYKFVDEAQKRKYRASLPFTYMEKVVANSGIAAVYDHPNFGIAIYKATMAGNHDIYGRPATFFLYTANGARPIKVDASDDRLLLLRDHYDGSSLQQVAVRYGEQLGKVRETISTNVAAMRQAYLITTDKNNVIAVQMALEAVNEMPAVIADPKLKFAEAIKVINFDFDDNLKSLEDEYNTLTGKFMEEVGFPYQNIDKKERLVAKEADDNKASLIAFDREPYRQRLDFIELMEEKFDIKLILEKSNEELYETAESLVTKTVKDEEKDV